MSLAQSTHYNITLLQKLNNCARRACSQTTLVLDLAREEQRIRNRRKPGCCGRTSTHALPLVCMFVYVCVCVQRVRTYGAFRQHTVYMTAPSGKEMYRLMMEIVMACLPSSHVVVVVTPQRGGSFVSWLLACCLLAARWVGGWLVVCIIVLT